MADSAMASPAAMTSPAAMASPAAARLRDGCGHHGQHRDCEGSKEAHPAEGRAVRALTHFS
jgi:hypothetical protein